MHTITCRNLRTLAAAAFIAMTLAAASAQTESIIHTFTGSGDGNPSNGALVGDGKGNFFGTTEGAGPNGAGTVYELSPGSNGTWTEQILYSFSWTNGAAAPYGGVVFDGNGNLYGTTAYGGANSMGTVFELSPGSNGVWTEKILYSFAGGTSGQNPFGGIVFDRAGNIYGIASGGANRNGVAYELVPGSNGSWTEKVLRSFTGKNDGSALFFGSTVVLDAAGNVYGVASDGPHDYGIVFELVHGMNGGWTEKILYAFTGPTDGGGPFAGLVFDAAGNLYAGATFGIFELNPQSNGTWTQKVIYSFKGGSDGVFPESPLTVDKAGNLYGMTSGGGRHRGTVFELSPGANGTWTEKILHRFAPDGVDGVTPFLGGLVFDANGNLYGTTQSGGASGYGVAFKITP